jgi:hypothetical protein
MNESDLRIHFYKTLSDESVYNKRASLHWYMMIRNYLSNVLSIAL